MRMNAHVGHSQTLKDGGKLKRMTRGGGGGVCAGDPVIEARFRNIAY